SVPPRMVPAKAPAPPPQPSEEGRKGELDVMESTNGERNGDARPPAEGASAPGLVAEKIAFGESEIVLYRRVERKSCSRYMLKDMFD
ncbi:MAG: hypothetical protein ACRDGR_03235, partial [bacterium]